MNEPELNKILDEALEKLDKLKAELKKNREEIYNKMEIDLEDSK